MNRPNITTIGFSILIINMAILSFLFFSHAGKRQIHSGRHNHKNDLAANHRHMVHGHKNFGMSAYPASRIMDGLDLSGTQKEKMDALRKEKKEKSAQLQHKIGELRNKESAHIKNGTLDEALINTFASEFGQYQQELHRIKLQHFQDMGAILSPEQKEKFLKEFNAEGKEWKKNREFKQ